MPLGPMHRMMARSRSGSSKFSETISFGNNRRRSPKNEQQASCLQTDRGHIATPNRKTAPAWVPPRDSNGLRQLSTEGFRDTDPRHALPAQLAYRGPGVPSRGG